MNHVLINMQIPQFDSANCLSVGDPDLFFHNGKEVNAKEQIQAAKKVCSSCIHKTECAEFAIENEIQYGVWGGMSESERRRIFRQNGKYEMTSTLEEAVFLRSQGYKDADIAQMLGITLDGLKKAFRKHYKKYKIGYVPNWKAS